MIEEQKQGKTAVVTNSYSIMAATMAVLVLISASPFLPLPHVDIIQVAYGQGFQNIVQGQLTKPATNATGSDNATSTPSFPTLAAGGEQVGSFAIIHSDNNIVATVTMNVPVSTQGNVYEAWLVDDTTGHHHSLGMLTPDSFGPRTQDTLSLTQDMVNPYLYDKIVVTEESEINLAPTPSTIIVGGSDIPDPFGG
jgi:Anti-sigma-K factor rskA